MIAEQIHRPPGCAGTVEPGGRPVFAALERIFKHFSRYAGFLKPTKDLRVICAPMNRLFLPAALLTLSLAGCASRTQPASAPSPVPPPASAEAPHPSGEQPLFTQTGFASFYGRSHDGHVTADGEKFDRKEYTAAHRTLAFGTIVRVTNTQNGRTVKVAINDRGPEVKDRIIDLSSAAARVLGMKKDGVVPVRLEVFPADQSASPNRTD